MLKVSQVNYSLIILDSEETYDIAAGASITVGFSPFVLGMFNQQSLLPLRYAPISIEFELVNTATDAVKGNTAVAPAALNESE